MKINIKAAWLVCPESRDETHFLPLPLVVPIAEFDPADQCVGSSMSVGTEMLCDWKNRRILVDASKTFTETFPQSAPSLADVNDRATTAGVCPVQSLLDYASVRGMAYGPLFITHDGSPVLRGELSKMLGSVIRLCNLDPNRYKGHSFRIGALLMQLNKGFLMARLGIRADGNLMLTKSISG